MATPGRIGIDGAPELGRSAVKSCKIPPPSPQSLEAPAAGLNLSLLWHGAG